MNDVETAKAITKVIMLAQQQAFEGFPQAFKYNNKKWRKMKKRHKKEWELLKKELNI